MKLTAAQLDEALARLEGWTVEDGFLVKRFTYPDFVTAFSFMTRVALLAEKAWHHPNWSNVWGTVTIRLTTHDEGGLTDKDTSLAAAIDAVA